MPTGNLRQNNLVSPLSGVQGEMDQRIRSIVCTENHFEMHLGAILLTIIYYRCSRRKSAAISLISDRSRTISLQPYQSA